ncbi:MAG: anaerobic ribonucleoside-triphosphate reductase activating protein [Tannerellaceae bacterium]|nr:anaerobic ribonucleoside-triphosphate reductase activating protein [Tannerellaceae bacterium]
MLSILNIIEDTTVDGPGFRTAVYAAGCPNRCPGCHNPDSWDIHKGTWTPVEEILEVILRNEFANVTFSGGDPFFQPEGFAKLARLIKEKSNKNIWCYTGYSFETIMKSPAQQELLSYIDVLVDGRFKQSQRQEGLVFRGSRNQRLLDVHASLSSCRPILLDYEARIKISECLN